LQNSLDPKIEYIFTRVTQQNLIAHFLQGNRFGVSDVSSVQEICKQKLAGEMTRNTKARSGKMSLFLFRLFQIYLAYQSKNGFRLISTFKPKLSCSLQRVIHKRSLTTGQAGIFDFLGSQRNTSWNFSLSLPIVVSRSSGPPSSLNLMYHFQNSTWTDAFLGNALTNPGRLVLLPRANSLQTERFFIEVKFSLSQNTKCKTNFWVVSTHTVRPVATRAFGCSSLYMFLCPQIVLCPETFASNI